MRTWWAVAALGVFVVPDAARADMGAPWLKGRGQFVVYGRPGDHPSYAFYLVAPGWVRPGEWTPGPHRPPEPERLTVGERVRPYYGSRRPHQWILVALQKERAEREEVTWATLGVGAPGVRHSDPITLTLPEAEFVFWPVDYEVRHFRIDFDGDRLTLTPGAVELQSNGFASWVPALLLTAAIVGAGLWAARRFTRRVPTPSGAPPPTPDAPL